MGPKVDLFLKPCFAAVCFAFCAFVALPEKTSEDSRYKDLTLRLKSISTGA